MKLREIGSHQVPEIGLGCMNLSHAYGTKPTEEEAIKVLHGALDLGVKHFDTAALYGFGANETLLGKALKGKRQDIHLASKCAMTGVDGKRVIDGRPESYTKHKAPSPSSYPTSALCCYLPLTAQFACPPSGELLEGMVMKYQTRRWDSARAGTK